MTRQLGQASYITFVKGLNTEAGPLTFPENSTIEDVNCVLTLKGSHKRRYGIKQEIDGEPLVVGDYILYDDFKDYALNTYTWKAPANIGSKTFLVIQVVDRLLFYDISNNDALPLTSTSLIVDLSSLIVDEEQFKNTGCSFSSGKGYLFVCGRGLEPCYVSYDGATNEVSLSKQIIQIRDTSGIEDNLDNNFQPTELSNEHLYNLMNQGWLYASSMDTVEVRAQATVAYMDSIESDIYINNSLVATVTTQSLKDGTFNTYDANTRAGLTVYFTGTTFVFTSDQDKTDSYLTSSIYVKYSTLSIISYGSFPIYGRKDVGVSNTDLFKPVKTGPEDISSIQSTAPYLEYYASKGKYPSNSQQWFVGRETGQRINVNEVASFDFGNKKAPRGHFIIDAFTEDRSTYVSTIPPKTDSIRIIDTAFMGGRVFYLRQNSLLYSQVIEDIKQAGKCYTEGDPTSEDAFDVVDTDGGVITITDMGDAIALFELQNGLAVFAKNGIWLVTGVSSDESFKATGYSVRKLSNLECVSKNSIVNVQGVPLFWATSGIYVITQRDYLGYEVQSLSDQTIQSKYVEIPKHNLKNAVGLYNSGAQRVAWFYDVTPETSLAEKMRETKALIYDVRLQAFYELEMDKEEEGHPFLCGSYNTPYLSFVSLDDEVFDNDGNLVLDNDENIVYTREAIKNTDLTDIKYLAFEKDVIPAGIKKIQYNDVWYTRDTEDDLSSSTLLPLAWKDANGNIIYTQYEEPTPNIFARNDAYYYRDPDNDREASGTPYYAWRCYAPILSTIWTTTNQDNYAAGDTIYTFYSATPTSIGTIDAIGNPNSVDCLVLNSGGARVYGGLSQDMDMGLEEDLWYVNLTSCNFDDINFKDWKDVNFVSTFTTGANTCGDSFITKDIVYLTTQLSRTEALNLQNDIGNQSSCLMQMKWDFEDNEYSHKWTTPVQIYRNRRIFAPGLDTPGFDDIAVRMPVVTTKHKVRGDGKALQIKFSSEEGKNFEVLGWNLIVGARS